MKIIRKHWDSATTIFEKFSLHTFRFIRKCVFNDIDLTKILLMLKHAIIERLNHSHQRMFKNILSKIIDWIKIVTRNYFANSMNLEMLEKFNFNDRKSFFFYVNVNAQFSLKFVDHDKAEIKTMFDQLKSFLKKLSSSPSKETSKNDELSISKSTSSKSSQN